MPDLTFRIDGAEVLQFAATPSLNFKLYIENQGTELVHSILLKAQIQIVPSRRHYTSQEQEQLYELFGLPAHWANSLKTMLWANTVEFVPSFRGNAAVNLVIPCTYDFEVATSKYFHSLEEGDVPLEFLFSGSVFYAGETGLQVEQISWDKEVAYRLPVRFWKETMEHYFPNSAWLRLRRDVFDRLYSYKASHGMHNWDAALERLLAEAQEEIRS